MKPKFFETQLDFRDWLAHHHEQESELLVGFYKVNSGKQSMTWSESVDQALCFGWIDGVRKSIDKESYTIRFTPRRTTSIWSAINIKKMEELTIKGLMQPSGIAAFAHRTAQKSKIYSHENEAKKLSAPFEKQFKAHKKAWDFFKDQAPSYQKVMIHWIMSAKQEKTQISRLEKTIAFSETGKRMT
jgi:uncharacterized protein YdeI (YjbR/CyaY-like superfamily)